MGRYTESRDRSHSDSVKRRRQLLSIVVAAYLYTSFPTLLSLVQDGRTYDLLNSTGTVVLTTFAQSIRDPLLVLMLLVCILVILANVRKLPSRSANRLLLIGGTLLSFGVVDYFLVGSINSGILVVTLLATAIWSLGLRRADLHVFGGVATFLSLATLLLAVWWPAAWQRDDEKGFFGEEVLAGPFSQMNVLGIALALLLPFSFTHKARWLKALTFLAMGTALVLTASRTSLIAAGISVLMMLVLRIQKSHTTRSLTYVVATVLVLMVVVALPLVTTNRAAFTARGGIWIDAREFTADSWELGHGLRTFAFGGPLYQVTHEQAAHAHNLFLQYLAMLGVVGVLGLIILLRTMMNTAKRALGETVLLSGAVMVVIGLGIAEVPIRVEVFDGPAWIAWPIILSTIFVRDEMPAEAETSEVHAGRPAGRTVLDMGRKAR